MSLDPNGPLMKSKGLARQISMRSGASGTNPLTETVAAIQQQQAAEKLQQFQMEEIERAHRASVQQAQTEEAKARNEQLMAEAQSEQISEQLARIRESRGGGQGNDMMTLMLTKLMQDQESARAEAANVREKMTDSLATQLAEFRADMRAQMAGVSSKRPPADELAENISQLTALRNVMSEFLPRAQITNAGGDIDITIKQLQLQQDFELRKEQLNMEREARQREWDERKAQRDAEIRLRQMELGVKDRRNTEFSNMLKPMISRAADALGEVGAPAGARGPAMGGGPGAPPVAEKMVGDAGTLHCLDCNTPIPIKASDTVVTCPGCQRVYPLHNVSD